MPHFATPELQFIFQNSDSISISLLWSESQFVPAIGRVSSGRTVGEVTIVQGLGYDLDEKAAEAARRSLFLPAVKDGRFASMRLPMTMSFSTSK